MQEAKDRKAVWRQLVNEDIFGAPDHQLSRSWAASQASARRKLRELPERMIEGLGQSLSGLGIVQSDILDGLFHLAQRNSLNPELHSGAGISFGLPMERSHARTCSPSTPASVSSVARLSSTAAMNAWSTCSASHAWGESRIPAARPSFVITIASSEAPSCASKRGSSFCASSIGTMPSVALICVITDSFAPTPASRSMYCSPARFDS